MNAKETARQIKKELNAAFNNGKPQDQKIKFSVVSKYVQGIGYDSIKISWVGGVFVEEVKAIAEKYNTYVDYSDTMSDYFRAEGVHVEYDRDLDQSDIDFLTQHVLTDFPVNYEVTFKKCYDSEGFGFTVKMDGDWVSRSDKRYQQLVQYNETGAISEEIPSYIWEKAWLASGEKGVQHLALVEEKKEAEKIARQEKRDLHTVKESIKVRVVFPLHPKFGQVIDVTRHTYTDPDDQWVSVSIDEGDGQLLPPDDYEEVIESVSNVVSFAQYKERQNKSEPTIENDYLQLADFLLEMPIDRRTRILKELTESTSPRVYVQSLLESMRAITALGFWRKDAIPLRPC